MRDCSRIRIEIRRAAAFLASGPARRLFVRWRRGILVLSGFPSGLAAFRPIGSSRLLGIECRSIWIWVRLAVFSRLPRVSRTGVRIVFRRLDHGSDRNLSVPRIPGIPRPCSGH